MRLSRLKLTNFRQYYQEQSIEFSQDRKNNVTVIHGDNGSGKTTILNSLTWLFYDEVNLTNPGNLANERAMGEAEEGDTVEVEVKLEFDHEENRYVATKRAEYKKQHADDYTGGMINKDISVYYTTSSGERKRRGDPEEALQQIMPERLRDLFFFDGETISELSKQDSHGKIETAIQNIMGLTVLENAKRHLDAVEKRFEDRAKDLGGDELQGLINKKQTKKKRLEEKKEEKSRVKEEKERIGSRIEEIKEKLSDREDVAHLQEEREELSDQISKLESQIAEKNEELRKIISEWGFLTFGMDAVEKTAEDLEDMREKKEIPTDIKKQFVDDLLEVNECICGRPLEEGTEEYENVERWRERAGSKELDQAAMTLTSKLSRMHEKRKELFEELELKVDERASLNDKKRRKEERESEIGEKIKDSDASETRNLENKKEELLEKRRDKRDDIARLEIRIEDLGEAIEGLDDEIEQAEEEAERAKLARTRARAARETKEVIEDLFSKKQDEVRQRVNDRVNEIFSSIIKKDYYAEIDEDFHLNILKEAGEEGTVQLPVGQSRGERQVASLSFIASLVSLAKEKHNSENEIADFEGGIYPIVMDSPFGALGKTYRKRVSETMPEMSEQVVVLVTDSQWSDEVKEEMDSIAGNKYFLDYNDGEEDYTEVREEETLAQEV